MLALHSLMRASHPALRADDVKARVVVGRPYRHRFDALCAEGWIGRIAGVAYISHAAGRHAWLFANALMMWSIPSGRHKAVAGARRRYVETGYSAAPL